MISHPGGNGNDIPRQCRGLGRQRRADAGVRPYDNHGERQQPGDHEGRPYITATAHGCRQRNRGTHDERRTATMGRMPMALTGKMPVPRYGKSFRQGPLPGEPIHSV